MSGSKSWDEAFDIPAVTANTAPVRPYPPSHGPTGALRFRCLLQSRPSQRFSPK